MTNLVKPQQVALESGQGLSRTLRSFYTFNYVLSVITLLLGVAGLVMGTNLARGSGGSSEVVLFVGGAIGLLIFIGLAALGLRALRSAADAVGAAGQYADGNPLQSGSVSDFIRWLSVGQWVSLILGGLGTLLSLGLFSSIMMLAGRDQDSGLSMLVSGLSGLGSVARNVIQVVLTWLALGAMKNFFQSLLNRAAGKPQAVLPSAQSAGNWLIFTAVITGLGALAMALGIFMMLAAVAIPSMSGSQGNSAGGFILWATLPLVLSLAAVVWTIFLLLQSRKLAVNAGIALDSQPTEGQGLSDPWQNAVLEQP